jgi:hypothetical protein
MRKGRWKKQVLCGMLSLAMVAGVITGIPSGATVLAAKPTESVTEAGTDVEFLAAEGERENYLSTNSGTYYSLVSHDYAEIKAALESDRNYEIRLDGDVCKTMGSIIHAGDSEALLITADIFTFGTSEIVFTQDAWAPTYVSEEGRRSGGSYKLNVLTPQYVITLGAGDKILELDGHDFTVENPDFCNIDSTLFQVNAGSSFIVKDDKSEGEIFYDGYILDSVDYDQVKTATGGDQQRNLIEVNGGTFTLNGGSLRGGRSKNESGFCLGNAKKKGTNDAYTGSATKYVNSTAIVLKSGEVTINKGIIEGRGYEEINISYSNKKNAVIEAISGKLTFNDGFVKAKGGADCFKIDNEVETIVRMGEFTLHRNDALFCGQTGSSRHYYIDPNQPFGVVGIPANAIPSQTWVEYGTGYHKGKNMLNSSNWRTDFQNDVDGHHGKDDYEPWLILYPDGGYGSLTSVANPNLDVPELNPRERGQLSFTYDLDSTFSFIPEEVRRTGGWKREYEFIFYNPGGKQMKVSCLQATDETKVSYGRDDYNLSHTYTCIPTDVHTAYDSNFKLDKTYTVACIMKETYYGSKTYTATTIASKQFMTKELHAPTLSWPLDSTKQVEKKGAEVSLTASASEAIDVKWYKKTKISNTAEINSDEYTVNFENGRLISTLTTRVYEEATYYAVFSNTVGSVTTDCKVTYPVSFVYTDNVSATIYKSVGGEISAPVEGKMDSSYYFQWYYWFNKVDSNSIFTAKGNTLRIPANNNSIPTSDQDTMNVFFCELRQKKGSDDVLVATSPWFVVDYVDQTPPERSIPGLVIEGLADKMYIGQKAPTADQIYIRYNNDVDSRVRVKNVTVTGVNGDGVITSHNPTVTLQLETTAKYYYFQGKYDYDHYGNDPVIFYQAGPYIWGYATMASEVTGYVNVVINFDGSSGHYALDKMPDSIILGRNTYEFVKDQYYDIPLDFELEMDSYAASINEKHYISSVEGYSVSSNIIGWPKELTVCRTGTKTNAYGQSEPTYSLRGTFTKTYSGNRYTYFDVYVKGDSDYPDGRKYGVRLNYTVVDAPTVTSEEAGEIAKTDAETKATAHVHEMLDWYPTDSRLDKYTKVHQRVCKYYDSDFDENGNDLDGGCYYVEEEPHDFYDVEILTEATAEQAGTKRCRCAVCGLELEREYRLNPEGHIVTLDMNLGEGYGNQTKELDVPDGEFVLPTLVFQHPDGRIFGGWELDDKVYQADEKINVKKSITLKVRWIVETLDNSSPKLIGASATETDITVSWIANAGVFKYKVFRKEKGGKWINVGVTTGSGNENKKAIAGTTCKFVDATAVPGVSYFYTVRGVNKNGNYVTSYNTVGVSAQIAKQETLDKSSPKLISAEGQAEGIQVVWKANSGVFQYSIFRKVNGGKWVRIDATTGTGNESVSAVAGAECSYIDKTAQPDIAYIYTVRGMDKNGKYVTSYDATGISGTFVAVQLDKSSPKLLGVSSVNGGMNMTWTANSGVPKYAIFRKLEGGKWANIGTTTGSGNESVQATAGATCSYLDTTAEDGKTYIYTVRGMDENGKYVTSFDATGVSGTFVAVQLDKSSPKLLGASPVNGGMNVTWTSNSGVLKYAIFRKPEGGKYAKIGETTGSGDESVQATAGTTCSFVDATAEDGKTYTYTVRGIDANGSYVTSYDAKGVSATMTSQPEELDASSPVLLGATASANGITVTWTANAGVFKYQVFRKVTGGKWAKLEITTGSGNESVKATAGSTCSFVDGAAESGVTYVYTVRGVDESGNYVTSFDSKGVSCTR